MNSVVCAWCALSSFIHSEQNSPTLQKFEVGFVPKRGEGKFLQNGLIKHYPVCNPCVTGPNLIPGSGFIQPLSSHGARQYMAVTNESTACHSFRCYTGSDVFSWNTQAMREFVGPSLYILAQLQF